MLDINPLLNAGHFKEAEALARHELEASPGQLHASLTLGQVLLRRRALAEAEEVLEAASVSYTHLTLPTILRV